MGGAVFEGMQIVKKLTMNGRYNRAKYLLSVMVVSLVANVTAIVGSVAGSLVNTREIPELFISLALLLFSLVVMSILIVKRLHDLNRSFAHFFRLAIPVYNVYLVFILFFRKGTDGGNRYGVDPLAREQKKMLALF